MPTEEERKERHAARSRKYYAENTEKCLAKTKQYHEDHKEERQAYRKEKYQEAQEEQCARSRKYYAEHLEERRAYNEQYRNTHKEETRLYSQSRKIENRITSSKQVRTLGGRFTAGKSKAKGRGLIWAITLEEHQLFLSMPCYYCNGPLPETGSGLDRLNNLLGYTQENCVPCCKNCNWRKGQIEATGLRYPRTVELMHELMALKKQESEQPASTELVFQET
jgi:hypothetical protein